jgi:tetratricopeptide (TPR) repeat protein
MNNQSVQELNQTAWQSRYTDRQASEALSRQALELAEKGADELGQGFALRSIAHAQLMSGQPEQSLEPLTRALEIARSNCDQVLERDSLNLLAQVHNWFGDLDRAVGLVNEAYRLSLELQDHATVSACLNNISIIYHQLGQDLTSLEYAQEAIERAVALGDRVREAIALSNAGVACSGLSQFQAGLNVIERSQKLCNELKLEDLKLRNRVNRSEILLGLGKLDEALLEVNQALEVLRAQGVKEGEAQCLFLLGQIRLAQGNHQEAEDYIGQALELAIETKSRALEASVRRILAQANKDLGHFEAALQNLEQAGRIEREVRTEGAHRRMRTLSKLNLVDRLENLLRTQH